MNAIERRKVWDAIVGTLSLDPEIDRDGAVRLAEEAREAIAYAHRGSIEEARAARRLRRRKYWRRHWGWYFFPALLGTIVFSVFTFAIPDNSHDYAGYGPSKVESHAADAMIDWWHAQNPAPQFVEVAQERSDYNGWQAWRVLYKVDGKRVCAYVWDGAIGPENQVVTGAHC